MIQSSVSLVEENDDVSIQIATKKKNRMFDICKEFCFIFAVTFTAYATVLNSQTKTKKGPPPIPFFHRGSVVEDFYKGDLVQLMHQVSDAGLAFVMFYAPWDADSQDARDEFEQTAQFYFKKMYFAGVNCWEPGSECRSTFKDISSFPQLIAYNGPRKAIEYRGPYDADHMIRFVYSLLNPISRVNTITDVFKLRYTHDAVVVGCLKFKGMFGGPAYQVLYETALGMAGKDHERHTAFAVFTHDRNNLLMGILKTPTILMYLWDKEIVYNGEMNSDALYAWVMENTNNGLSQIYSNSVLTHVKSGAVMLMFTPRHPLSFINPYYQLLRRVAMKFNSCGNSSGMAQEDFMIHLLQYEKFLDSYENELLREDSANREECTRMHKSRIQRCSTVSARSWSNLTCYETTQYCLDIKMRYSNKLMNKYRSRRINGKDWRSPEELIANAKRERCNLLARTSGVLKPKKSSLAPIMPSACDLNTTITFLALDSFRYFHLAQGLGVDLTRNKHNTAVLIFNQEETLKLENDEVTEEAVANLLSAYISGEKKRFLRYSKSQKRPYQVEDQRVSVIELNTLTFQNVVLNETETVLVLYHSPYCSFCQAVSHVFLTVAYLLRGLPHLVMARVDGENNDLPWQYTVYAYPSVLIFPAQRKSESRKFPQWLGLTVHSLSQFVLANLDVEERIQGKLAICAKWGNRPEASDEGEVCLKGVRISCLEAISETLRKYRSVSIRVKHWRADNEIRVLRLTLRRLLLRLQYLKSAHLLLERVQDIQQTIKTLKNLSLNLGAVASVKNKKLGDEL